MTEMALSSNIDDFRETSTAWECRREFPLDLGYREPNEESLESIREADAIMAAGGTGESFDSGADLVAEALRA